MGHNHFLGLNSRLTFSERDPDWILHEEVAQIFPTPAAHWCNWEEWVRIPPIHQNTTNGYTSPPILFLYLMCPDLFYIY